MKKQDSLPKVPSGSDLTEPASLVERLARSKFLANAIGPNDPAFDEKSFSDEMWEDRQ